ncbi:MAG: Vps62-related protein, partial [Psychrosphaera sp.]|nr:Vps62-related protein [Psychrosphaera sp.]
TLYTPYNSDGGYDSNLGKTWYLDRHLLECRQSGQGLRGFGLQRNSQGTMYRYQYSCNSLPGNESNRPVQTTYNDDGNGNTIYLDRHTIDCGGYAIGDFQMIRPNGSQVAYKYTCGSKKLGEHFMDKYTRFSDDGDGNALYLDRHNVDCGSNGFVSKFKLERDASGEKIRYAYQCRPAQDLPLSTDKNTAASDAIKSHGPLFISHPDEKYLPISVEEFLAGSVLTDENNASVYVTKDNLFNQGSILKSSNGNKEVWLKLLNDDVKSGNLSNAKSYVNAQFKGNEVVLQFWNLYAYNGHGKIGFSLGFHETEFDIDPIGEHEGDWESVYVTVDRVFNEVTKVTFFAHGDAVVFNASEVDITNGQPVVYSSLNGHSSYPGQGDNINLVVHQNVAFGHIDIDLLNKAKYSQKQLNSSINYEIIKLDDEFTPNGKFIDFDGRWGGRKSLSIDAGKATEILWGHLLPEIVIMELACAAIPPCFFTGGNIWIPVALTVAAEAAANPILSSTGENNSSGPSRPNLNK